MDYGEIITNLHKEHEEEYKKEMRESTFRFSTMLFFLVVSIVCTAFIPNLYLKIGLAIVIALIEIPAFIGWMRSNSGVFYYMARCQNAKEEFTRMRYIFNVSSEAREVKKNGRKSVSKKR